MEPAVENIEQVMANVEPEMENIEPLMGDMEDQILGLLQRLQSYTSENYQSDNNDDMFRSCTDDGVPIRKLFIGNLAQRTSHKDLEKLFSKFGPIDSCYVRRNTGKTNFAFVTFCKVEDAMKATKAGIDKQISLHNRDLRVMPADSWHQPDSIENKCNMSQLNKTNDLTYVLNDDAEIHRLNNDCLTHIFTFLPIIDRVRIERVCKRWRSVSRESWRMFKKLDQKSSTWGFKGQNITPVWYHFDTSSLRKVLLRCGQFLTHINFSEPSENLTSTTLTVIGRMCPNLQFINILGLHVSSSGIQSLKDNCHDITEFILGSCTSPCDNDLAALFLQNKKLRHISISTNAINAKCLTCLPSESIETICLKECQCISSIILSNALQKLQKLHTLKLENCKSINDHAIEAICACSTLKHFELKEYFPMVTSEAINHIAYLTNLEVLDVAQNVTVKDEFLVAMGSSCKNLVNVDISCCYSVTDYGLSGIALLPKLKHLAVSYLTHITGEQFGDMCNLKTLHCRGCFALKDHGISALVENAQNLELLDLSGCIKITENFITAAGKATNSRTNHLVLKVFVGGVSSSLTEFLKEPLLPVSPFLSLLNVDLSDKLQRDYSRYEIDFSDDEYNEWEEPEYFYDFNMYSDDGGSDYAEF